jgi:hypothetical protein
MAGATARNESIRSNPAGRNFFGKKTLSAVNAQKVAALVFSSHSRQPLFSPEKIQLSLPCSGLDRLPPELTGNPRTSSAPQICPDSKGFCLVVATFLAHDRFMATRSVTLDFPL